MKKVVFFLVIILCTIGCSVKKIEEQTDAEKFAVEYNIKEKNPFHYVTIEEAITLFEKGSGIIFLGNSDGEWSRLCVKILNQAFLEQKIEKVNYLNLKMAEEHKEKYKKLTKQITSQLKKGEKLKTPALFFVKNGKIENYSLDYEVITTGNKEGYSEKEKKALRKKYINLIEKYQEKMTS